MEQKTRIAAEEGRQYFVITREFDLPVELLFKAHEDAELFEQWMSHEYGKARVVKWEMRQHGGWRFETADAQGNVLFGAGGVFHEVVANKKITRTFEMDGSLFDVQLEFLEFEQLTGDTSRLTMQSVFRNPQLRDEMLKLPFAQGLNMAHNRLQHLFSRLAGHS